MPMISLADLERRLRRLEMERDQDAHKLSATDRSVNKVLPPAPGIDSSAFGQPVFLTTPLTSTSWDGDSFSTTGKTLIDLSTVFGVPAGVKAILVQVTIRDSGSNAAELAGTVILSPNSTNYSGQYVSAGGVPADYRRWSMLLVPCDANGDIYYQLIASGIGTSDIWLEIWGYWL